GGKEKIKLQSIRLNGAFDFGDGVVERRKASGKTCGDGGNRNATALQSLDGGLDKQVIDADGADFEVEFADTELFEEFLLNGLASFSAETLYAFVSVVAGERSQVHAGDGAKKPGDLPIFFHSAAWD